MEIKKFYGTGKRKTSIARVWLKPGSGEIVVNEKNVNEYFTYSTWQLEIQRPLDLVNWDKKYNVTVNVYGGGLSGQAQAVKHGISKALVEMNQDLRSKLKKAGFLTRDSRVKERKKYGQKGARARYQFSKR
ncbi:MAG: 30S ribosomal protein S9 [bacterium]